MYKPGVDVAQQASGRPGSSNTDHPCGGLDAHVRQNTSLASFKQKHSFVLPPPRKWHFPARHDEDILGKCRSDYDEAAKVLINGLKADGWLSIASIRLVIENMIDVIRHPAQFIGDFMRSPFKFSNDTKELVAMVLDSTPEVNSVFDRVDKFVLDRGNYKPRQLPRGNKPPALSANIISILTHTKTRLVANNLET